MSIFTSNIPLIVNNISTMKDVSAQNMDLSGSLDVSGNTTIGGTLDVETSLTTNQLIVNDSLLFDTIVIRRPNEVITTDTSVPSAGSINIRELQCWVNEVNILATNAGSLNSYFAYWSDKENDIGYRSTFSPELAYNEIINTGADFAIGPENSATDFAFIIKNVPKSSITAIQSFIYYNRDSNTWGQRAIGLAVEFYNIDNDPNLESPLATTNEISSYEEVYRFDFPAIDTYPTGDFSDTESISNIASETLALKEVVSEFADSANITGGLKVDTITTTGNVDISGNASITGDLVVGTTNIITELGTKQDEITTDTDLTLNSITTSSLNTSGRVGFDTTNIQFNTLVLRRPTGSDMIALNEIQVWVNDVNIMVEPSNSLIGYFANWDTDKDTELPPLSYEGTIRSVDKVYNNILENDNDFGSHSGYNNTNAMIIKNIPLTNINDIQSIVYYNRSGEDRSIGLVLELYNIDNDAGLIYPLASSNVITTYQLRYRYDFPSITSYSGFADGNSIDDIVNDSIALTETINVSNIEMVGNVDISGDLVVGTTNIITEIGTKQDEINDGDLTIANTNGLQTALDNKYDDTGGTISGSVTITSDLIVGTTNIITEIGTKQDTIDDDDLTIAKTSGLQTALDNKYDDTGGTIGGNVTITGDLVVGSTNIIDEIGTKQDTIDETTHLIVDRITTESTTIDCEMNGRLVTANKKMFINNVEKDLEGLTSYNLEIVQPFLSGNYLSYSSGLFTFQNLTDTDVHLFIVTLVMSVESDTYDERVNWRLTPYLDNNNFNGYGRFYTTTEGATEINRYSTLMVRTLVGARNDQVYRLTLDCNKEGDSTFGSSMDGLKVRNASIFTFEYVGIN